MAREVAVKDPVHVLLDETDAGLRAAALVTLGDRLVARGDSAGAVRRYREALGLIGDHSDARARLAALGEPVAPFDRTPKTTFRSWLFGPAVGR